jgi:hypothetical protein
MAVIEWRCTMPHFANLYYSNEVSILEQAYKYACLEVGLSPSAPDFIDDHSVVRNRLTAAIIDAARSGERDPQTLSAFAVAIGLRNWHLSNR